MVSAGVYARISSDPEGTRLGVDRQVADCEDLAARLGWRVAQVYIDNDISAWSGKARPEYRRFCDDIKNGVIDGVVVFDSDRLYRHPRELEDFIDLCDAAGISRNIRTVREGEVDFSTANGRAMARMRGVMGRRSSDDASERLRRKHLELATKGKVSGGGARPFGYTADRLGVVPEEAAVIQEAARRVLAGESLRSVAADLNGRGVLTSGDRPWSVQTLKRVLGSARISGRREHHGQVVAKAVWPAIITVKESDRLRVMLAAGSAGVAPPGRSPRRYLLAGLLRCGLCHTPLVSRPRPGGQRRYVCASGPGFGGCGKLAVLADPVEDFIAQAVLWRLDTPQLAKALRNTKKANAAHDTLASQVADDQEMLDTLAADYAAKTITHREWLAARKPIQTRIDTNRRRLSRVSPTHAIDEFVGRSGALGELWAELPLTRQAAIVRTLLDQIEVAPALKGRNRFDPDRLTPSWRL